MFLPKAVYAQIADICYERERRGEPAYEMRVGREQLHRVPLGSICFIPDLRLKKGDPVPQFARIQHEPVLIATDNASTFVYVDANCGDFQMFDIDEEMEPNHEDDEHYILVVHGLNFLFSDTSAKPPSLAVQQQSIADHLKNAAKRSQQLADKLAPAKKGLPFL